MSDYPRSIPAFRVDVFAPNARSKDKALNGYEGVGDEWQTRSTLSVFYDDESFTVSLDDMWLALLNSPGLDRVEREVTGLCTIVKWGNTMQLKREFRVVIQLSELER